MDLVLRSYTYLSNARRRSTDNDKVSISSEDSAQNFTTSYETTAQQQLQSQAADSGTQHSSRSNSIEGTLDDMAESYIIEGMKQQQEQQDLSSTDQNESQPPNQSQESQTEVESKLSEIQDNVSDTSGRMNISGNSDLEGSSERGSEERTGCGNGRLAPSNHESLTANNSSGNLSELEHGEHVQYRKDKGNGHSTDSSSRLSASMDTPNNNINNNKNNKAPSESGSTGKKKKGYWYNVLSPTYKSRTEDFKKLFKDVPKEERLIVDYSCAMQRDILVHGRLYVTQNWICFYANIFRWETVITIKCSEIRSMTKERTARVIPNAIQICTPTDKYFFTSFAARDKTYLMLFRVWQNALMDQPMSAQELWQWVHYSYGDELGLTSSDDDYVAPNPDEELKLLAKLKEETGELEDGTEENGEMLNGDVISAATFPDISTNGHISGDDGLVSLTSASELPPSSTASAPPPPLHIVTPDATSGDLPTDLGDTSEDDVGVVTCSGHEHKKGHIYLDEVFNLSVDQIFQCIFTDSEFYRTFLSERKTYDIIQAPWPDDVDESGEKRREIGYTLSLNYSIGPKFTQSSEKQTILAQSKPGQLYVIVTDCTQSGIPYGENFYVQNRYCLMRVSSSKAKLIVQSEIKYRKNVWGLVKNLIEKNATLGMADNFKLMADFLRAEAEKTSPQGAGAGRKKMLRKRRPHASAPDRSPSLKRNTDPRGLHLTGGLQGQGAKGSVSEDEFHIKLSTDSLIYFVCAILLVLVLFNGFLFYKLWTLESKALSLHQFAHRRADHRHHDPLFTQPPRPHSTEEWNHIIDQQHRLHEMELERWKDVLTASVSLVDQMKITLQELLANIEHRTKLLADMVQQQREAPKH